MWGFPFFFVLFDGLKDLRALENEIDLKTIIMNIASEAYREKYTALMQTCINKKYHCGHWAQTFVYVKQPIDSARALLVA